MVESRAHAPKYRALEAYDAGRLGAQGRARIERHLAGCEPCRSTLSGLRRYAALVDDARTGPVPEPDWTRMELALARAGARERARRRWVRIALPAALAAAAAALLVIARPWVARGPETAPHVARKERVAVPAAPAPQLAVRITAIVGAASARDASGAEQAVDLDLRPSEGWSLSTGPGSELHLVIGERAAVLIGPRSQLALSRLRDAVELSLAQGRVVSAVRPLAAGERYAVFALGHEVAVRGTHFSVERPDQDLGVQVDEGAVVVLRDGTIVAELRAPQRWTLSGGLAAQGGKARAQLPRPRQPAAGFASWPELRIPAWNKVVAWELDSARLSAAGELAMRVPPGDVDVTALLADGRRIRGRVHVDSIGARFDPRALRWAAAVEPPQPDAPADPSAAAAVIRAGQAQLQRCYERSMRNQPAARLHARLTLRIDGRGRVRDAELSAAAPIPEELTNCVRTVAQRWAFVADGTGITIEAPIRFLPRQ